jgi:HlyD family secretion protein
VEIARAAAGGRGPLAKSVIRSPIDGVVTRLNIEEGETAIVGTMNNPGSLLLTVSDLSVMEAVIRVDETDVPDISLGDSTVLTIDAFPRQKFTGRVTEISHSSTLPTPEPGAEPAVPGGGLRGGHHARQPAAQHPPGPVGHGRGRHRPARQCAGHPHHRPHRPGAKGRGDARDGADPEQEAAPPSLASDDEDVEGVFVIRDGKARFTVVSVGITGREHFEVTAGLAEGDSVVAGPYEADPRIQRWGYATRPTGCESRATPAKTPE